MSKKNPKDYLTIYVHPSSKRGKDFAEEALDEVDCNFSRILCMLFGPLYKICKIIAAIGKNYRHFSWHIIVKDRASGSYYCSDDRLQVRKRPK